MNFLASWNIFWSAIGKIFGYAEKTAQTPVQKEVQEARKEGETDHAFVDDLIDKRKG